MIREYFMNREKSGKEKIKWRSHEITRIEALSDAVFAFAVSLLVFSLEVPKNSKEMLESIWGLFPFAFSFLVIFWIWRAQYKFFRRYGLHDWTTQTLNGLLLFFTLGFVYPLKFLFSSIFLPQYYSVRPQDIAPMIMFYNGGFVIIELLFSFMYLYAYRKRATIQLTSVEAFETINYIGIFAIPAAASFIAVVIAWLERNNGSDKINFCFMAYALLGIFMPLFELWRKKSFNKKFGRIPITEPQYNPEK
jgi:uncharacterized membrane protein